MKLLFNLVLLIMLAFIAGCAPIRISPEKMAVYKEDVKKCMGVTSKIPPAIIQIEETDKVMCNGFKRGGCFQPPRTIILPRHTTENYIKHEWVHYILFVTTGDLDAKHISPYFLKCSGMIPEDENEHI